MNKRRIVNLLGKIILTEVMLMIPSLIVALIYGDGDWKYFVATMIPAAIIGFLFVKIKAPEKAMRSRDGYCIVALAWIIISVIGAFPLYFSGEFETYCGAFFEIVSGFTTTGASVLKEPANLPHGVLFWRSFSHWIGGMGVLVFVMMIMPMENENSMHLVKAEVPGPVAGKLVPRMKKTSMILYGMYAAMTIVLVVLLLFGGVNLYDAFCLAFGTAGTGGFAVSAAGVAGYGSAYVEIVIAIFMILFGVNFNLYHLILLKKVKDAVKNEELWWYLGFIGFATVTIAINIYNTVENVGTAFRHSFFQVSSIITTTGFATVDFDMWPEYSKHMLVVLMIVGACAGSTGGGMKVSRVIILVKSFINE
ncbi:MAG: TrkH family potassium uptake protein, partial [Lachnospira sp.]|nr:TrkH family potassium uptake protein [Lachnospira sp.]